MGTISFKIYPDLKLAHFQGFGDISFGMFIDKIRHLHKHPLWQFGFNTFIDFEKAVVKAEEDAFLQYQDFFNTLQKNTPVRKWAIYSRQESTHQTANMSYLLNLRSIIVDVFHHRDEALRFLDVSPQQFMFPAGEE